MACAKSMATLRAAWKAVEELQWGKLQVPSPYELHLQLEGETSRFKIFQ